MRCFENLKDKNEGDLWDFVVHPDYRNKGIAKQMLQYLHRRFKKMLAKTDANNKLMINLLKTFGYISDDLTAPRVIKWYRN
jgi:ribosomal protein S18 acetylase RimI-like enzyme